MEIRLEYKLSIAEQEQFIRDVAETASLFSKLGANKGLRVFHDIPVSGY